MIVAGPSPFEQERLAALAALDILDTPPEPFFDAVAAAASRLCAAPIALVSLVDAERQWFKARIGLDACETGRDVAFCAHAILATQPLVVPDALADPRFHDNPLVHNPPFVRAYAGAPIITADGHALGTLCVIHHEPTVLAPAQIAALTDLARAIAQHLELRRAAGAVRRREATLHRFVRATPAAVALFDRDLQVVAASERWSATFAAADDAACRFGPALRACLMQGAAQSAPEEIVPDGAGGERVLQWEMRPWLSDDGAVGGVLMAVDDITLAHSAAREIAAYNERLNLALELAGAAVWEYDPQARRLFVSETLPQLVGEQPGAPDLAQRLLQRLPAEDRADFKAAWERHVAGGPPVDRDHRLIAHNGETLWVRSYAELRRDPQTGRLRALGFVKNVDRRKKDELALARALAEAQAAAQAQGVFLANMSHEIRTPLNGVVGLAGVLAQMPLPDDAARLVRVVEESGAHLARLLDDVLDISKAEAGRLDLEQTAFSPLDVVRSVVELLRPQAERKGLTLSAVLHTALDRPCVGDPTRLKQVLTNLVSNAIKFTDAGSVVVQAEFEPLAGDGEILRCTIADTGIGMSAETLAGLFQRFTQADASIARRFGGSGLGLAISKSLIELMGGEISVTSELGGGSTFLVRAPLRLLPAVAALTPSAAQPQAGAALSGRRVLVVDDHAINRMLVDLVLSPFGVAVDEVDAGGAALAALEGRSYDLVLMDMHMPEMDGLTAIRLLRQREAERGLPRSRVLMLTASALPKDRERARLAGADGFVAKPVRPETLVSAVRGALASPSAASAA